MATNPLTPRVNNIETGGTWKIGDVKQSFLTEAEFQAEHDDTWVLCDGRDVIGSDYAVLKEGDAVTSHNIPDARGQFLRGKNNSRNDGNQDPDGERSLGDFQQDKMQGHHHKIQAAPGITGGSVYNITNSFRSDQHNGAFCAARAKTLESDGLNGTPRTGVETRPKNVTCNMFIKINREPSS